MSNITISRIQNRRGLRANLPQPLAPGELGLCEDTLELFIGKDPTQTPAGIRVFIKDAQAATAQSLLSTGIVVIEIDSLLTQLELSDLKTDFELGANVTEVTIEQFYSTSTSGYWMVVGIRSSDLPQAQTEIAGVAFTQRIASYSGVIDLDGKASLILDSNDELAVPDHEYAGALATAVNFSGSAGLITSNLNLKIFTEAVSTDDTTAIIGTESLNNYLAEPVAITLNQTATYASTGLAFTASESDVMTIDYSLSATDFAQTGNFTITTLGSTANLTDENVVIDNTSGASIDFRAVVSGGNVVIEYRHDIVTPVTLKTLTKRWLKF